MSASIMPAANRRLPPIDSGRVATAAADFPDPRRKSIQERLGELRSWLDRKHAGCRRPCSERAALEDLTRLVNLAAIAAEEGRLSFAEQFLNAIRPEPTPTEIWLG